MKGCLVETVSAFKYPYSLLHFLNSLALAWDHMATSGQWIYVKGQSIEAARRGVSPPILLSLCQEALEAMCPRWPSYNMEESCLTWVEFTPSRNNLLGYAPEILEFIYYNRYLSFLL